MTERDFKELRIGDIVRHVTGADAFVVVGNDGAHITIARVNTISNPVEWKLIFTARYFRDNPERLREGDVLFAVPRHGFNSMSGIDLEDARTPAHEAFDHCVECSTDSPVDGECINVDFLLKLDALSRASQTQGR